MRVDSLNDPFVAFVLSDLDLALMFMDIAEVSSIAATKERNHQHARKAYDTVLTSLQQLSPDAQQQAAIDTKLAYSKAAS